jgi:hypothetical protein
MQGVKPAIFQRVYYPLYTRELIVIAFNKTPIFEDVFYQTLSFYVPFDLPAFCCAGTNSRDAISPTYNLLSRDDKTQPRFPTANG